MAVFKLILCVNRRRAEDALFNVQKIVQVHGSFDDTHTNAVQLN